MKYLPVSLRPNQSEARGIHANGITERNVPNVGCNRSLTRLERATAIPSGIAMTEAVTKPASTRKTLIPTSCQNWAERTIVPSPDNVAAGLGRTTGEGFHMTVTICHVKARSAKPTRPASIRWICFNELIQRSTYVLANLLAITVVKQTFSR